MKYLLGLLRESSVTRTVAAGDGLGKECAVRLRDVSAIKCNLVSVQSNSILQNDLQLIANGVSSSKVATRSIFGDLTLLRC